MSLGLHQKCKDRLVEIIKEALPKVSVSKRMFLDRKSAIYLFLAESVVPTRGEIKKNLESFVGDAPVFDFIYETLAQELHENQEFDADAEVLQLNELEGYEDTEQVAIRLVDDIDSLPWCYKFTIEFHKEISEALLPILGINKLSDTIRIREINESFDEEYSLVSGIEARDRKVGRGGLLNIFSKNEWNKGTLCIQFEQEGFVGYYGDTTTTEIANNSLKSFCGLAIALRLFKVDTKYRSTPSKAMFYIHRNIDEDWIIQSSQDLDSATSDTFHDLVLHDLGGKLDNEEKQKVWVNGVFSDIEKVFSNLDKNKKLLLGCQWLFDSYSGKNELLSFVQTTVVIEILLGDKASSDQMGLGVLLRNRCAYLIGNTQSQRDEILKDFQDIYDVRSKIVHRGKNRLNMHERSLFGKLQWMCRRVIHQEVILLKEELNNV